MNYLATYFGILVSFCALDAAWLSVMKSVYAKQMGGLVATKPTLWAIGLFYPMYAAGMILLVTAPHAAEAWWKVLLYSMLFGFIAYMTYDLTNIAVIKQFPIAISIVDIIWGIVASGIAGIVGYFILKAFA